MSFDVHNLITEKLKAIIGRQLTDDEFAMPFDTIGIDSLEIVCFLCELEDALGINLQMENINPVECNTPEKIEQYIDQLCSKI